MIRTYSRSIEFKGILWVINRFRRHRVILVSLSPPAITASFVIKYVWELTKTPAPFLFQNCVSQYPQTLWKSLNELKIHYSPGNNCRRSITESRRMWVLWGKRLTNSMLCLRFALSCVIDQKQTFKFVNKKYCSENPAK